MKIYEIIRQKQAEQKNIENRFNKKVLDILKKWFPEYEVDYSFNDVTFKYSFNVWCRFNLYSAETYGGQVTTPSAFRLSRNEGFTKKEIKNIKDKLSKLYEGAY